MPSCQLPSVAISSTTGHIRNAEVIEAKALSDAVEQGRALLRRSSHPHMEIWDGATKVFPVSAPSAAADD
jgi:hypothetical protein